LDDDKSPSSLLRVPGNQTIGTYDRGNLEGDGAYLRESVGGFIPQE